MAVPNPELRERVRALFGGGLSHSAMAAQLGTTKGAVSGMARRLGLTDGSRAAGSRFKYTAEQDDLILRMVADGKTNAEIAEAVRGDKRLASAISHHLTVIGMQRDPPGADAVALNAGYTAEQRDKVLELARINWAIAAIAPVVRLSERQVRRIMHKGGIQRRPKTITPNAAQAAPASNEPIMESWHIIIAWWRDNAPPKLARRWPQIGEVNELRRAKKRRPFIPMTGLRSPGPGRREAW